MAVALADAEPWSRSCGNQNHRGAIRNGVFPLASPSFTFPCLIVRLAKFSSTFAARCSC